MIKKTKERLSFERVDRKSIIFDESSVCFKCCLGIRYRYDFSLNELYSDYKSSAKSKSGTIIYTHKNLLKRSVHKGKTDCSGGYYLGASLLGRTNRLHRLVAYLKYGNSVFENEIDHIDGNRENNSPENLRVCSRKENAKYASERGAFYARNLYSGRIQKKDVIEIKKLLKKGVKQQEIADLYEVDASNISKINTNKWKSIKYIKGV